LDIKGRYFTQCREFCKDFDILLLFLGRGRRNTYHHTTLIKIDGCNDKQASEFYLGKKIAYIYRAKTIKAGSKFRVVWGKVMRSHGSNGVVRAKFTKNLTVWLVCQLIFLTSLNILYIVICHRITSQNNALP